MISLSFISQARTIAQHAIASGLIHLPVARVKIEGYHNHYMRELRRRWYEQGLTARGTPRLRKWNRLDGMTTEQKAQRKRAQIRINMWNKRHPFNHPDYD